MVSMVNSTKKLKKKWQQFYQFFQKIKDKEALSNSFYEARITLIQNWTWTNYRLI